MGNLRSGGCVTKAELIELEKKLREAQFRLTYSSVSANQEEGTMLAIRALYAAEQAVINLRRSEAFREG